jgi:hypothetical protein
MSASIAEISIGSVTFKVLNADISYYQLLQIGGKASSDIRGGTFSVEFETSDGTQFDQLAEWMFSKTAMKKGFIRFYKKDGVGRLFDFEFYDAYCIKYTEKFDYSDSQPMITTLTISPGITRFRNLVKERPWKVSEKEEDIKITNNSSRRLTERLTEPELIINNDKEGLTEDTEEIKYRRNMAERRKALLRDSEDPNSDLTDEAREHIIKSNGNKVPSGYEVSHETPLYTQETLEGKKALDTSQNMKTQKKSIHRARHKFCGDQFHKYPR